MYHRRPFCLFLILAVIIFGIIVDCKECGVGYFLNEDKCYACNDSRCTACTSNTNCTTCESGYYGTTCQNNCILCRNGTCSKDGCTQGCKDGYYSGYDNFCIFCNPPCATCTHIGCDSCIIRGKWGLTCLLYCSIGCAKCIGVHGHCIECDDGYTLLENTCYLNCPVGCSSCTPSNTSSPIECTTCSNGYYKSGNMCYSSCYENCKGYQPCNISSEACYDGCMDGWTGPKCDKHCPIGCIICDQFNDTCIECENGYYGEKCNTACSNNCKTGMTTCNKNNGTCSHGCTNAYTGVICGEHCASGCIICDQFNGTCIECENGYYGEICTRSCSNNCKAWMGDVNSTTCNKDNGTCNHGCIGGYTGVTCDEPTSKSDQEDTLIIGGSAGGMVFLLIVAITIVMCIVMRKWKRSPPNVTNAAMPTSSLTVAYYPTHIDITNTVCTNKSEPLTAQANISGTQESPLLGRQTTEIDVKTRLVTHDETICVDVELDDEDFDDGSDEIPSPIVIETQAVDSIYYTNVAGLKQSRIPVDKLQEYVTKKTNDDITDEFLKLPQGLTRPFNDALKPGNRVKNRYRSIYPYDVSRVKLTGGASDFINANYIDGYNQPEAYIASQGPTAKTMDNFVDFWRMVWQENVEKIVMLTNLIEDTKIKCEKYWPNVGTSQTFGEVTVTCNSGALYAEYTVRVLTVCKERSLYHLHFTAWPDKGVPDDVTGLIEFRQKVESSCAVLGGPVIVHCSAGVASTGTYIALDILTKEGNAEKSVDIFGCVLGMRSQRVAMIQTEEQYRYLHNCVVYALTFDYQAIQGDEFQQYLANSTVKLYTQFNHMRSSREADADVHLNRELYEKNRNGADLPDDRYRPRLYNRNEPGASDYINATFVNSFKSKNRYIIAQTPLPETVVDFLTLVFQENCSCIVSMDEEELATGKKFGVYLPTTNQTLKQGPFQISSSSSDPTPHYKLSKLTIKHRGLNWSEVKTVNHFQFSCWAKAMTVPNAPSTFIKFIKDVERASTEFTNMGPILIHCLTGAERSGLFCAVSVLIQKMESEHEVSVVNTARQIKSRRRGAIPNMEQYIFCHMCVEAFIQTFGHHSK